MWSSDAIEAHVGKSNAGGTLRQVGSTFLGFDENHHPLEKRVSNRTYEVKATDKAISQQTTQSSSLLKHVPPASQVTRDLMLVSTTSTTEVIAKLSPPPFVIYQTHNDPIARVSEPASMVAPWPQGEEIDVFVVGGGRLLDLLASPAADPLDKAVPIHTSQPPPDEKDMMASRARVL
jgi:hypothetical protein